MINTKGQLISKCPFGRKTSPKKPTKNFWISALKFFVASLGLPGSFWGLPVGFLMYDITYYVPRKPKKLPESPQVATNKISGQKSGNFSLFFWEKFSNQKDILKLTDLYTSDYVLYEWYL